MKLFCFVFFLIWELIECCSEKLWYQLATRWTVPNNLLSLSHSLEGWFLVFVIFLRFFGWSENEMKKQWNFKFGIVLEKYKVEWMCEFSLSFFFFLQKCECCYLCCFECHSYQVEALEAAVKRNTIVYFETGTGKTLIAIMLLRNYSYMLRKPSQFISVFLVPQVVLVKQVCNLQLCLYTLRFNIYEFDIFILEFVYVYVYVCMHNI